MATKMMLKQLFSLKFIISLFAVNIFCDLISVQKCLKLGKELPVDLVKQMLFERFVCNDMGIINFAVYLSVIGLITFTVINFVNADLQKNGLFVITRMTRAKYVLAKFISIFLFVAVCSASTVLQSLVFDCIFGVKYFPGYYYGAFIAVMLALMCAVFIGACICSYISDPKIAFVFSVLFLVLYSVFLSNSGVPVPSVQAMSMEYCYLAVPAVLLSILFIAILYTHDFITTKIKE